MGFMKVKHESKLSAVSEILRTADSQSKQNSPLFKCIQLNQNWVKITGAKWGKISKPAGYSGGCLTIQAPSSCHIQEMSFDKEIIVKKINKFLGSNFVKDIRWTSC